MKFFTFLILTLLSFSAMASQKIQKIFEESPLLNDHSTLFLSDGEIVHFDRTNLDLLGKAKSALENSFFVEFEKENETASDSDTAAIVTDIYLLPALIKESALNNVSPETLNKLRLKFLDLDSRDPLSGDTPTRFSTYDQAQSLMNTFDGATSDESQCYNRAHMWTYEAFAEQRVNLNKVWIFFTHKYIREYKYKWWFHVSPYAMVADANERYVLDRGFTQVPFNMTNWKNIFIKSKQECPIIKDYRQYENNQEAAHCYLIYSNQFYWQPYQLKNLSTQGTQKFEYQMSDLRISYKDALIRWDGRIPRMPTTSRPDTPNRPRPRPEPRDDENMYLRVGQQVISSNGVEGYVTRIIDSSVVEVQFQTANRPMPQYASTLAVRFGSSGGFSVGDWVWSQNGVPGIVSGIFRDGRVTVQYQGNRQHIWQYPNTLRRRR